MAKKKSRGTRFVTPEELGAEQVPARRTRTTKKTLRSAAETSQHISLPDINLKEMDVIHNLARSANRKESEVYLYLIWKAVQK